MTYPGSYLHQLPTAHVLELPRAYFLTGVFQLR